MDRKGNALFITICLLALSAVILITGCGMLELFSAWCDRKVSIDGISGGAEWNGALHSMPDRGFTIGILNDEKMLYLCLSTRNQALQRKIMTAGLIVWFNETGDKRLSYGIHFPLPSREGEHGPEPPAYPGKDGIPKMDSSGRPDPLGEIPQADMEILRPGENERSVIAAERTPVGGVRCRIRNSRGVLVYELQVPLIRNGDFPHGISAKKPKIIGIGLVTGGKEEPRPDGGDRDGSPGGGRGPGCPGGPGGPGGPDGGKPGGGPGGAGQPPQESPDRGGMHDKMQSLDLWLKVHLAERIKASAKKF